MGEGFDTGGDAAELAFEKTDGAVRVTDFGKTREWVKKYLSPFI